nr:uncharacterized protein LOC129265204 [Lytechinus pictus]
MKIFYLYSGFGTVGAGGAGGRIAVYYTEHSFVGQMVAYGGVGSNLKNGAAGTVYQESRNPLSVHRTLLVDNNGLQVPDTMITDYNNLQTVGTKTWFPATANNMEFDELTLLGNAHLAFEAIESLTLIVAKVIGPSVHEGSFGTLHIGLYQSFQLNEVDIILPFNLKLYHDATLTILPPGVTFQSSQNFINGRVIGGGDVTVIDAELSYGQHARSGNTPEATIVLHSLQIRYGGIVSFLDGIEEYTIRAGTVNLSPGGILRGRALLMEDVDTLTIEETAILTVDHANPFSQNTEFRSGSGGSLGGEGGYGHVTSTRTYPITDISSPNLFGEPGQCRWNPCLNGESPAGGGKLLIKAHTIINRGTISASGEDTPNSMQAGGGSGGSIWLECTNIDSTDDATIQIFYSIHRQE